MKTIRNIKIDIGDNFLVLLIVCCSLSTCIYVRHDKQKTERARIDCYGDEQE